MVEEQQDTKEPISYVKFSSSIVVIRNSDELRGICFPLDN